MFGQLKTEVKNRVVDATVSLFSHGPQPLEHTLDHMGDPGLLGPDSVSWRVIGDATAFVGGIRALLVQTAHPEVVAGVEDHSAYRTDPLGRLSRTAVYVTETTYGALPEVEATVAAVRRAHAPVRGRSERDRAYSAGHPEMAAWVHNVLTDSFLAAYRAYGPTPLTAHEADRFVEEQTRIGALLGADPMPETEADLRSWIVDHPEIQRTKALHNAVDFLRDPPLSAPVKMGYKALMNAAVATIPAELGSLIGVEASARGVDLGRKSVAAMRWALGSSPSWHLALIRTGADIPTDVTFRQPLPTG